MHYNGALTKEERDLFRRQTAAEFGEIFLGMKDPEEISHYVNSGFNNIPDKTVRIYSKSRNR
jgi:hypothetical protein